MDKHDKTRYVFAQAIKDLIKMTSLDKITVTDIVMRSGMTRQTFYRHFKDKYDLVNWYFEKLVLKSFRKMGNGCSVEICEANPEHPHYPACILQLIAFEFAAVLLYPACHWLPLWPICRNNSLCLSYSPNRAPPTVFSPNPKQILYLYYSKYLY